MPSGHSTFRNGAGEFDLYDRGPREGPAVILLHGFPQDSTCWDRVVPDLNDGGLRTVAFDQRGYSTGARPSSVGAYTLRHLVQDVFDLADHLEIERFHLVGHDWGGVVTWAAGLRHPERLLSITSLSTPHPAAYKAALRDPVQAVRSVYALFFQVPVAPEAALLLAGGAPLRRLMRSGGLPDSDARHYTERMREPGALRAALSWYRAAFRSGSSGPASSGPSAAPSGSSHPGARKVSVPVLHMWGAGDPALGRRATEITEAYVEGPYELDVLEAGHWLPETRAEEVAAAIASHVSRFDA